jgi:hypothetical protein
MPNPYEAERREKKANAIAWFCKANGITSELARVAAKPERIKIAWQARCKMPSDQTWERVVSILQDAEKIQVGQH